ncbi:hypothetical protein [Haliangium ochraceum]|uniref:Uncharacterized protein n=1 Tax=Haliangium ochraceum (strain DSM 14365 / JCM 11303 / SMP-2) TaxID=502025 RepID=D0LNX8_HALO1|nr:hypothetical protein [Haliangium ochraceum]ACY18804.1 hypothetical protein Hoch_6334 [Haliangium ochraceum DSM 14365]
MKRFIICAVTALSSLAATAHAQEAATGSPALGYDSMLRSEELSTIDGQLVEVGDHHRYSYRHRQWNVAANPASFLLGWYSGSVSYAPHRHVAVRGDLTYYNTIADGFEGYEANIGVPIYPRHMYSGMFLEPGVMLRVSRDDSGSKVAAGPQVLLGHHWYWDSGFNMAIAAGAGHDWTTAGGEEGVDDIGDTLFVNGYLRFGYAF